SAVPRLTGVSCWVCYCTFCTTRQCRKNVVKLAEAVAGSTQVRSTAGAVGQALIHFFPFRQMTGFNFQKSLQKAGPYRVSPSGETRGGCQRRSRSPAAAKAD